MSKADIKLYSWIVRGSQRSKVLGIMEKPLSPTQIKKMTGLALNNVSDVLRLFVKWKIAVCINENEKLGRIYVLTKKGIKVKKMIND